MVFAKLTEKCEEKLTELFGWSWRNEGLRYTPSALSIILLPYQMKLLRPFVRAVISFLTLLDSRPSVFGS
jgi:hypothetical protein